MLDQLRPSQHPQPHQLERPEIQAAIPYFFGARNVLPLHVNTPAGQSRAGLEIVQVISDELPVRQAVHIHENQALGRADANGAVEDARLAETFVLMPDMLERIAKARRPAGQQRSVVVGRSIVGHDDFEFLPALPRESRKVALDDIEIVVAGDDYRRRGFHSLSNISKDRRKRQSICHARA